MFAGSGLRIRSQDLLNRFPGAFAAYSLRDLGWYKPVVRVRRSGDNAEQDFNAKEINNGSLTSFCGAGNGFVTTWYDQSGNNKNAVQSTLNKQPLIVLSGNLLKQGGEAKLDFGNPLYLLNASSISHSGNMTAISVATLDVDTQTNSNIFDGFSCSHRSSMGRDLLSGGRARLSGSTILTSANQLLSGQRLFFGLWRGLSGGALYLNGSVEIQTADNFTSALASGIVIGANCLGEPLWQGSIQELVLYPSDLSEVRVSLETSVNNYYRVY